MENRHLYKMLFLMTNCIIGSCWIDILIFSQLYSWQIKEFGFCHGPKLPSTFQLQFFGLLGLQPLWYDFDQLPGKDTVSACLTLQFLLLFSHGKVFKRSTKFVNRLTFFYPILMRVVEELVVEVMYMKSHVLDWIWLIILLYFVSQNWRWECVKEKQIEEVF